MREEGTKMSENEERKYYHMNIAGCERDLPICPISDTLDIAGFVMLGDVEITEKTAEALPAILDGIAAAGLSADTVTAVLASTSTEP